MNAETCPLEPLLSRLAGVLQKAGSIPESLRARLAELRTRLAEERFHLAVLGQFKRGKSSVLNALLGEPLLPTSVIPLTAIPTFLQAGPVRRLQVTFRDGRTEEMALDRLPEFVTEEGNPRNLKGVVRVEVEHPAELLAQGVVLIDTPGIGSTLTHNTAATLDFLPQCDAALFVVSADPPLTEVEVEFLQAVREKVAHLFFLLNKVDYLSPEEQEEALTFLRRVLRERVGMNGDLPIFPVSAREALHSRINGRPELWRESGLAAVEQHLFDFLRRDKARTLRIAVARKARQVAAEARMLLELELRALEMPLADLEEKAAAFAREMERARRDRQAVADGLAGERRRMAEFLEEEAERLRARARAEFQATLRQALDSLPPQTSWTAAERTVREALDQAIPAFFEAARADLSRRLVEQVNAGLEGHLARVNDLVSRVRQGAADLFAVSLPPLTLDEPLARMPEPYWITQALPCSLSILPEGGVARWLPAGKRRVRLERYFQENLERVVRHNVENLRWPLRQSLEAAFRRYAARLEERFVETVEATAAAIAAAQERRRETGETVEPARQQLQASRSELVDLEATLTECEA